MPTDPDELWRCGYCNQLFPVPTLARDHEAMHEREASCGSSTKPTKTS